MTAEGELVCEGLTSGTYKAVNAAESGADCQASADGFECQTSWDEDEPSPCPRTWGTWTCRRRRATRACGSGDRRLDSFFGVRTRRDARPRRASAESRVSLLPKSIVTKSIATHPNASTRASRSQRSTRDATRGVPGVSSLTRAPPQRARSASPPRRRIPRRRASKSRPTPPPDQPPRVRRPTRPGAPGPRRRTRGSARGRIWRPSFPRARCVPRSPTKRPSPPRAPPRHPPPRPAQRARRRTRASPSPPSVAVERASCPASARNRSTRPS